MNPQNDPRLEKRLRELEEEIMQPQRIPREARSGQSLRSLWMDTQNWYGSLSTGGKVITAVLGLVIASMLLSAALRLLVVAMQLAVLGVILYAVYRWVLRSP